MADVDLQIVREFFELNQFLVTTHWPQHDPDDYADGSAQLYIERQSVRDAEPAPTILLERHLDSIRRAVVEVRPWHTDRFYASLLEANPVLLKFAEPTALGHAADFFGTDDFKRILVISELPRTLEQREQLLHRLSSSRVDHLIEFPTILQVLTDRVALTGTYTGSPLLQLLQHLKRYRLLRNQQLEIMFPREPRPSVPGSRVDVSASPEEPAD